MTDGSDVDAATGPDAQGGVGGRVGGEAGEAYPPPVHVLRDLGLDVEVLEGGMTRGRLEARVAPHEDTGALVPFGVVSTAVDILAGAVCGRAIVPDWMATSVMSLHLGDVVADREVVLDAAVLRAGRSSVTVEVEVIQGDPVGSALLTFSRLPRRATTLVLPDAGGAPGDRYGFGDLDAASGRIATGIDGFDAAIGCRSDLGDPTRLEADVSPYVRNSFGAVNGGVVAAVADAAGRHAVEHGTGVTGPWRTLDLTANLLGQGRHGPMTTSARVVRSAALNCAVRVEVADAGQVDDSGSPRLMAIAHVILGPA